MSQEINTAIKATVVDPLGRKIIVKDKTWTNKILNYGNINGDKRFGNSHAEMEYLWDEVVNSLQSPAFILRDTALVGYDDTGNPIWEPSENREHYIGLYFSETDSKLKAIKSVVEHTIDGGELVTTHKMNANRISKEAGVIYDATKKS
ncbi:MAG: hypothetical protein ACLRSH_06790 [Turicibacter sp.]